MSEMRFLDALAELDSRQPNRMLPDLSRVTEVSDLLDNPQLTYPTIHITGTNGKTTAARLAAQIACAHGVSTGLYTSPHLLTVTERLTVCGELMSDAEFAEEYMHLLPYLQVVDTHGERVTYFEVLTLLAYLWFADKPVGLGVFEVGMGGEWDATNLVAGDVAIITPIGMDHPELGATIAEKAKEKSRIIKPGKVAVVREQSPEALDVIETWAAEVSATILLEDRDWAVEDRVPAVGGQALTIRSPETTYEEVVLSLFGPYAAHNAAAATVAVEAQFGRALDNDALREALGSAVSLGRLEVVGRHPLMILDGAHNPAGAGALREGLEEAFTWEKCFLVVACSADKDVPAMLEPLSGIVTTAFATEYDGERSMPAGALADACRAAGMQAQTEPGVAQAIAAAKAAAGEADLVLVTGSLFTIGDATRALAHS